MARVRICGSRKENRTYKGFQSSAPPQTDFFVSSISSMDARAGICTGGNGPSNYL
jgi:hypothetical protein